MKIRFCVLEISFKLFERSEDQQDVGAVVGTGASADLTTTDASLDRIETTRLGFHPSEYK